MRNFLRPLQVNVSPAERGVSLLTGAILLYDALGKTKKSSIEAIVAGYLLFRGASGNCLLYNAIGKTKPNNRSRNVNIRIKQVVNKPREEVYAFWRNLENLPLFMEHLDSVRALNDSISVWEATIPGGMGVVRWKSELVKERTDEFLGWQSLPGSPIRNVGKVEFRDFGDDTELHIVLSYHAPGGIPGEGAARLLNPIFEELVEQDIRNFKWFIEREYLH